MTSLGEWAHGLPGPEVGSVLLAQSGASASSALHHIAVILILSHGEWRCPSSMHTLCDLLGTGGAPLRLWGPFIVQTACLSP
jgi:hypothetical protein